MAQEITTSNHQELLDAGKPVVIDFWAEWCGPCRMIAPVVEELATEYDGRVAVTKCDVDNNDALAAKYAVRNIPTLVFIKNGEVVDKMVGAASKDAIKAKIDALL